MKYYNLILSILLLCSCTSLSRFIEIGSEYIEVDKPILKFSFNKEIVKTTHTVVLELPSIPELEIEPDPDPDFVLQPFNQKLSTSKKHILLTYNDTISYFNENTFTEKFKIIKREIPVKILEVN